MTFGHSIRVLTATAALAAAFGARAELGDGMNVAGARLHPYLNLEGRYDSNVLYTVQGRQNGDFITHVRPGFTLEVPGDAPVTLGANLDWAQYAKETNLSKMYGAASAEVRIDPKGALGLVASDEFSRSNRTPSLALPYSSISNYNALTFAVPWRPGGRALTVQVGGQWIAETFQPVLKGNVCGGATTSPLCETAAVSKLDYNELRAIGQVSWKFLPRTSFVFDVAYVSRLPGNRDVSVAVDRLDAKFGMTGLLTPTLAGTIKGGWGDTLHSGGRDYGTPLVDLEGVWTPSTGLSARGGYVHALGTEPGPTLGFYHHNRVYVDGRWDFGQRYRAHITGSYDRLGFPDARFLDGVGSVEPGLDAMLTKWLRVGAAYAFTYRCGTGLRPCLENIFSGKTDQNIHGVAGIPGFVDYKKHEVWLRADVIY